MAEIVQKDGSWTFDGEMLRIVPGAGKGVSPLRRLLGEVAVPLRALAGIAYERGRRSGRLRLRLREGADPLLQVAGGRLDPVSDPYRLTVDSDRSGVAEYLVERVRSTLLLEEVPASPVDRYLLPGPAVPLSVAAGDGCAGFDGERIRLEWSWKTEESKASGGPRTLRLAEVVAVQWRPSSGLDNGHLRFRTATGSGAQDVPPQHDPHTVELWGFRRDSAMALVGAAVTVRLPHPSAARPAAAPARPGAVPAHPGAAPDHPAPDRDLIASPAADRSLVRTPTAPGALAPAGTPVPVDGDPDVLLRRLRELGELRRQGLLTADEFATAKQAVLRRL
ncbi:DUF4429 domain-containing protein [Streptomyces sp. NBC_01497]|uniref:DUF4429 domain-containing protein n=1 Tax=Streptomyces sp. NBC_01497 TaxID=2903885 RepID=UPI002E3424D7|nr:DUF4429 domain-containing protein [Streptomyces sp. NBC_01497]